jgi:TPP-dependent pyruvate/acetoin dehydrogenase alpha subunit
VDGNDLLAVRKATLEAVARARAGRGPTLIEARTFRMGGHSTSDDPKRYVPAEQMQYWKERDPLPRFEKFLAASGLANAAQSAALRKEVEAEVAAAVRAAEQVGPPGLETIFSDVYAAIPTHIRKQGEELFDLGQRRGDAHAGDGKFPL